MSTDSQTEQGAVQVAVCYKRVGRAGGSDVVAVGVVAVSNPQQPPVQEELGHPGGMSPGCWEQ